MGQEQIPNTLKNNKFVMNSEQEIIEHHTFIIVGAGIAGLQSALTCSEAGKDFLLLEASQLCGGRINTSTLDQIVKEEQIKVSNLAWFTEAVGKVPLQFGATWLSADQPNMNKLVKEAGLTLFPQFDSGDYVYGVSENNYVRVKALSAYFLKEHKEDCELLFSELDSLRKKYQALEGNRQARIQFIRHYDSITMDAFLRDLFPKEQTFKMMMQEAETLNCVPTSKLSALQHILEDDTFENIKFYVGIIDQNIDGFRLQEGVSSIIKYLQERIEAKLAVQGKTITSVIHLNEPVIQIDNDKEGDEKMMVATKTKRGRRIYSCDHVILAVPISTTHKINIHRISECKKMIYDNQEEGNIVRMNYIFPTAFWREKYTGYVSFSSKFLFNELVDLSPSSLVCGILSYVIVTGRLNKWREQMQIKHGASAQKEMNDYGLKVIADMFLDGDINHQYLKDCFVVTRSLETKEYIGGIYQSLPKIKARLQVEEKGERFEDVYCADMHRITVIGSEVADQWAGYMEGAITHAKNKVSELCAQCT